MKVRLRFFASLREALGPGEEVELPAGSTLAGLRERLVQRGGVYAERLGEQRAVRAAIDQRMVTDDAPLADGAEVAFFPPVTGG